MTPIKIGKFVKFNPLKFFFLTIFEISELIFFLKLSPKLFIFFTLTNFFSFLDIISILSNDIDLFPLRGKASLFLTFF